MLLNVFCFEAGIFLYYVGFKDQCAVLPSVSPVRGSVQRYQKLCVCACTERHLTMLVSWTQLLRKQHSHQLESDTPLGVVAQGGITAIDLSPSSEDIVASAGKDHTVQIYDRSATHFRPLHALHIVCVQQVLPYMLLPQKHFVFSCIEDAN